MNKIQSNPTQQFNLPTDRRKELTDLQKLLNEVASINKSTGAIQRIEQCIVLAEKLTKFDLDTPRASFSQWLVEEATKPLVYSGDDKPKGTESHA